MIVAFTGKTGSGKTFHMVKKAYSMWKDGVDVYSNTILEFEPKQWLDTEQTKPNPKYARYCEKIKPHRGRITYFEEISELLEVKNGLILIDEAQVLFNARNWENLPYEFQYKLQQHRKHQLDLFCTTQNMGTIDITYRRLVQAWYHHYDVFAFLGIRNPSIFSVHRVDTKDIDQLYNTVDDLIVDTVDTSHFIIHRFKKRLYDTMYDIGFKRFKTICLEELNTTTMKYEQLFWIIPKQMKLKDVLSAKRLYQSALGTSKSPYSRRA